MPMDSLSERLHMAAFFWWISLSACFIPATCKHVATSTLRLSRLTKFEQDLLQLVRDYNASLSSQFLNFVASVEAEYHRHREFGTNYEELPVHQYRLLRRFSVDWKFWKDHLKNQSNNFLAHYRNLSLKHDQIDKFSALDLPITAHSLTHIHIYYQDNARLLAGTEGAKHPALTNREILELAALLYNNDVENDGKIHKLLALHWLKLFSDRMRQPLPRATVADKIASFLEPLNSSELLNESGLKEALKTAGRSLDEDPDQVVKFRASVENTPNIMACRHLQDRSNGNHYCFIFHSSFAPYSRFHYEILSLQPYVAIVHNFLANKTAHKLIAKFRQGKFEVAGVLKNGTRQERLSIRLSETMYIYPDRRRLWLDYRVQEATLLQPNSISSDDVKPDGEPPHVVNYGVGGFYRGHHDYLHYSPKHFTSSQGDRLATILVYLSDVRSGGHTAFPKIGVSAVPRAGRALVWFNLDPYNGMPLKETLHTACPVNEGSKWIMTKWIRSHKKTGHSRPIL